MDFRKIDNGNLGAINLNNMIPVVDDALIPIDFNKITDFNYKRLLQKQYIAINKDKHGIITTAQKLHKLLFYPLNPQHLHSKELSVVVVIYLYLKKNVNSIRRDRLSIFSAQT